MRGIALAPDPAAWPPPGASPWETADPARLWQANAFFLALIAIGLFVNLALLLRWHTRPVRWAARSRRLAARPVRVRDALALALLLLAGFLAAGALAALRRDMPPAAGVLLQSALFGATILLYLAIALRRRGAGLRRAFGVRPGAWGRDAAAGLVCYLAALPYVATFSLLYRLALQRAGHEIAPQPVLRLFAAEQPLALRVLLIGLAVVLAPLAEEVLFRGVAQPLAARRFGMPAAIVLVSVLFALLHRHPVTYAPLFVLAVAFSIGYLRTGSIVTPIVAHALFNAVNLAILHGLQ